MMTYFVHPMSASAKPFCSADIGTLIHYPIPPHDQQAYSELGFPADACPIASRMASEVLRLPMGPQLQGLRARC